MRGLCTLIEHGMPLAAMGQLSLKHSLIASVVICYLLGSSTIMSTTEGFSAEPPLLLDLMLDGDLETPRLNAGEVLGEFLGDEILRPLMS